MCPCKLAVNSNALGTRHQYIPWACRQKWEKSCSEENGQALPLCSGATRAPSEGGCGSAASGWEQGAKEPDVRSHLPLRRRREVAWRSHSGCCEILFTFCRPSQDIIRRRFVRECKQRMGSVRYGAPFVDENEVKKHRTLYNTPRKKKEERNGLPVTNRVAQCSEIGRRLKSCLPATIWC